MNLELSDIKSLPSLPIPKRHLLPTLCAIYFVLSETDELLYIGQTSNLRTRWRGHECCADLDSPKLCKIAWFRVSDVTERLNLERALILKFRPPLNAPPAEPKPVKLLPVTVVKKPRAKGMLSSKEVSEKTGIAISTINLYCRNKRFPNAKKESTPFGDFWLIPETDLSLVTRRERGRPSKNSNNN